MAVSESRQSAIVRRQFKPPISRQRSRATICFFNSAIAFAGFKPFGHAFVQLRIAIGDGSFAELMGGVLFRL